MTRLIAVAAATAAALSLAPAAGATTGLTKTVSLGDTVTLRDGRQGDRIQARFYDYHEQRLARAPDYWRLTVRMDVRFTGRKPLPFRGRVWPLSETGRLAGYAANTRELPVLLVSGRLYRLTIALTVSNFNHEQGVSGIEYYPGLSTWPGPRDRGRWTL
jgi:2-polyprenyl-6-methoxyphenol hydroxylase-like FAD-dependent oxidoreductase